MTDNAGATAAGDPNYAGSSLPPAAPLPPEAPVPPAAPPVAGYQAPAAPVGGHAAPVNASPQGRSSGGPGGLGGFNSQSLQNFDPKTVNPLDWGIIGAGVLTFIFSLFSYYKYSVKVDLGGVKAASSSGTVSAWHGFFGWFAALVALAAAAVLAAHLIAKITLPFPVRLAVLGGFALALLCTLLALFVVPGNTGAAGAFGIKVDKGHGFSYWLSLLLLLGGTGLSFVRFTQTGGKLPSRA